MRDIFNTPEEFDDEYALLYRGYLNDMTELSMDKYIRTHASEALIKNWDDNQKRRKKELEMGFIIN